MELKQHYGDPNSTTTTKLFLSGDNISTILMKRAIEMLLDEIFKKWATKLHHSMQHRVTRKKQWIFWHEIN